MLKLFPWVHDGGLVGPVFQSTVMWWLVLESVARPVHRPSCLSANLVRERRLISRRHRVESVPVQDTHVVPLTTDMPHSRWTNITLMHRSPNVRDTFHLLYPSSLNVKCITVNAIRTFSFAVQLFLHRQRSSSTINFFSRKKVSLVTIIFYKVAVFVPSVRPPLVLVYNTHPSDVPVASSSSSS